MKPLLIILYFIVATPMVAQDTLVFSQEKSLMFSHKYILYPENKTFEHKFITDDGQIWYGIGTYEIKRGRLFLEFGDSNKEVNNESIITNVYNEFGESDTLIISLIDQNKSPIYAHVDVNEKVYNSNFNGIVKIPKKEFLTSQNEFIEITALGITYRVQLKDLSNLDGIMIESSTYPYTYHFESNFSRILKISKKRIKSKDYFSTTRKRKVKFILETGNE